MAVVEQAPETWGMLVTSGVTCRVFGVAIRVTDRYRFNILLFVSTCSHAKTNKTRGKTLGCHAIVK